MSRSRKRSTAYRLRRFIRHTARIQRRIARGIDPRSGARMLAELHPNHLEVQP